MLLKSTSSKRSTTNSAVKDTESGKVRANQRHSGTVKRGVKGRKEQHSIFRHCQESQKKSETVRNSKARVRQGRQEQKIYSDIVKGSQRMSGRVRCSKAMARVSSAGAAKYVQTESEKLRESQRQ